MNCTSKRRNARELVLEANVCPNPGHNFLETAPGRLWSPIAYAFRASHYWDGACRFEQDGSAARVTVVAPGARHDAKSCDISVVKYDQAYSVCWATHELEGGICGNEFIQVGNRPILPKEGA